MQIATVIYLELPKENSSANSYTVNYVELWSSSKTYGDYLMF